MTSNLDVIREIIAQHKGANIVYRASNGRRKTEERKGVIVESYPNLFTVYIESQKSTSSFSYTDVLTREVEIMLEENGEPLY
ncbi:MAG: Veg family protein [Synergistes sp.]|nr:Veg family protein [Synergistes sp.]